VTWQVQGRQDRIRRRHGREGAVPRPGEGSPARDDAAVAPDMRFFIGCLLSAWVALCAAQPLPTWNEGAAKSGTVELAKAVTTKGGKDYVPPAERVATFDNDGTLWAEQPMYFQFIFMLEQVKAAAPKHPEWKDNAAFQALVKQDHEALAKLGQKPLLELMGQGNSGMTVGDYDKTIRDWL